MPDQIANLRTIWELLQAAREDLIPEGDPQYDEQWEGVCTAMAQVTEELGIDTKDV